MIQSSLIKVEEIYKAFARGEPVLKGVSVDFLPGKLTYILGTSGAGKSVLLRHILGLLKPDRGRILVDGEDIHQVKGRALAKLRFKFGMLFQNSALFDSMTIFENVAFPLREHSKMPESEIQARVEKTLAQIGIKSGYGKYPNEISGGMKKRVGLARAIIREPSILMYDEPTTGLDPVTRTTVDELIGQLKQELSLTSIVISHDIPSALLRADQIAFLYHGEMVFLGNAEEFRESRHAAIQQFLHAEQRMLKAFGAS